MYKKAWCTCRVLVLRIKLTVFWRSRCRRRGFVRSLFSNRTGSSFDDGKARGKDLTRLPVLNLPLFHWSSQLFDLRAPSSNDVPVLLLNQPDAKHASLFAMKLEKLLVNDKITASCQTNMFPKHCIRRWRQLWETVRLASFQKPQLQSTSILFSFVHLPPFAFVMFYLYLL